MLHYLLFLLVGVGFVGGQRQWSPSNWSEAVYRDEQSLQHYWQHLGQLVVAELDHPKMTFWDKELLQRSDGIISPKCAQALVGMRQGSLWSHKMIHSNGLSLSGLLEDTMSNLGDFDRCMSIVGEKEEEEDVKFVGRYCFATATLPRKQLFDQFPANKQNRSALPDWVVATLDDWYRNDNYWPLALGLCFPSVCDGHEIRALLVQHPVMAKLEVKVDYCQDQRTSKQVDSRLWVALAFLLLILVVITLSTIFELSHHRHPSKQNAVVLKKIAHCFSLLTTVRQLGGIKMSKARHLDYLHGLRALVSAVILLDHITGSLALFGHAIPVSVVASGSKVIEMSRSLVLQPLIAVRFPVLVFFAISGLLTTYSLPRRGLQFVDHLLVRAFRFYPLIIGQFVMTFVFELLGSGPLFHHRLLWPLLEECYNRWYTNLLFIANWNNCSTACNSQNWYVSVEMQLRVVSFIVLLAYMRGKSRLASVLIGAFSIVGLVALVAVVNVFRLAPTARPTSWLYPEISWIDPTMRWVIFSVYGQAPVFFLGMYVGHCIRKESKCRLPVGVTRLLTCLAVVSMLAVSFSDYIYLQSSELVAGSTGLGDAVVYAGQVGLYSLGVAWLLYRLHHHQHHLVGRLLSAGFFQIFSRLSFGLYMGQIAVIWYNLMQLRRPLVMFTFIDLSKSVCSMAVHAYLAAVFLYLVFEAPANNLVETFYRKRPTSTAAVVTTAAEIGSVSLVSTKTNTGPIKE